MLCRCYSTNTSSDLAIRLTFSQLSAWLIYAIRRSERELRDSVLRRGLSDRNTTRKDVALRYLRGAGIEIGALDYPVRVQRGARVRYVDSIAALHNQLRVLKPGSILYLTLPDARQTFDVPRDRTTSDHYYVIIAKGPELSRQQH
jgi:hypothetical protein